MSRRRDLGARRRPRGLLGLVIGMDGAEREQWTIRIAQHHALHCRVERWRANDAGCDAQSLIEIDNAVADRCLVRKCRRRSVNEGL